MAQWVPFTDGAPAQTRWTRIDNRFSECRPAIDAHAALAVLSAARQTNSNMPTWPGARAHLPIAHLPVKPSIPVTLKGFEETAGPFMPEIALRRFAWL
jgi:hypothetical protein